ncbi:hypothetical protein CHS0354_036111 [Potamilus streckersoni]|uniref:Uncharacterized protein n=1 Tax=Potamilus streckersoni TaxID=2493646 RepID=A0AAE0T3N3_9BIVA|nr:hypothetical protein CHS0354_036111 [Potamilus streckersoni]
MANAQLAQAAQHCSKSRGIFNANRRLVLSLLEKQSLETQGRNLALLFSIDIEEEVPIDFDKVTHSPRLFHKT